MKIINNKYFRAFLALFIYFFMMNFLNKYITNLVVNLFNLKEFQFYLINYSNPFSLMLTPYSELVNFLNTLLQNTIYIILFISLCSILYVDLKKEEVDYINRSSELKKEFLPSILIYYGIIVGTNLIVMLLTKYLHVSNESLNQANIETLVNSSITNKILMACSVCFMGPIVEELIFRKSMFTLCYNKWLGLIVSSITFGLMHTLGFGYEPLRLLVVSLPYIASGFVFGIIYIRTDNIFMPILIHALLNTLSILMI